MGYDPREVGSAFPHSPYAAVLDQVATVLILFSVRRPAEAGCGSSTEKAETVLGLYIPPWACPSGMDSPSPLHVE